MSQNPAYRLQAGDLRHRIAIQSAVETRDAHGGVVQTWSTIANRWAVVRPLSGNERVNAMAISENVSHRIVLRHFAGLNTSMRIVYDQRVFGLVNILNIDSRDKLQVCLAVEVVDLATPVLMIWEDGEVIAWEDGEEMQWETA